MKQLEITLSNIYTDMFEESYALGVRIQEIQLCVNWLI